MQISTRIQQSIDTRNQIINTISNMIWWTNTQTQLVGLRGSGYIVSMLILIPIHRIFIKKHHICHQQIIQRYDHLRYQVAKIQQTHSGVSPETEIIKLINTPHASYLSATQAIQQSIITQEQNLGITIIPEHERNYIHKQLRKKHRLQQWKNIIGRIISIVTCGIYKLFR